MPWQKTPRPPRLATLGAVWAGVVVLVLAACQAAVILIARDRADATARAERDTANLARAIAQQAGRAITDADRILQFVAFDIRRFGTSDIRLRDILKDATAGSTLMFQLAFTDADGNLIMSNVDGPVAGINLADREHFRVHVEKPDTGLFISKPVFGRASGRWSIQLSRKIVTADGQFGGMVVASLDPFYFSRSFAALDVGKHGAVIMVGTDGVMRARSDMNDDTIGRDLSSSPMHQAASATPSGFIRQVSSFDKVTRLVGYRAIDGYPLYVAVAFGEDEFMATLAPREMTYTATAGVASVLLILLGALATWQDRTQQRARAAAERASAMKDAFLATISHELRTPMNGVLGMLSLLGDGRLDNEQARQVDLARRSASSLLTLLDDLLDFAKLEAGKIVLAPTRCDIRLLAGESLDLMHPAADAKGIELALDISAHVPDRIRVDAGRLRQILLNLLGNAVKFTESGQVRLRIGVGPTQPDGRFALEVAVEDTGIGIPADAMPHLFQAFRQADSSVSRRFGGTGLGLAICRQLCEVMGGDIGATSVPGRGSIFRFTVMAQADTMPEEAPRPIQVENDEISPMSVLVVDDHPINRDVLAGLLGRIGHHVDTAEGGADAVSRVRANSYDVVLMDLQMPEMDGFAATARIRALEGPMRHVPIIAVTAHAQKEARGECLEAGMNGMVTKPVRVKALLDEIASIRLAAQPMPAPATEEPPEAEQADLLDVEQAQALIEALGDDFWRETVEAFSEGAHPEIAALHNAIDEGRPHKQAAHAIKGMALNMGAGKLGRRAAEIEHAPPDDARRLAADLAALLDRSSAALLDLLEAKRTPHHAD